MSITAQQLIYDAGGGSVGEVNISVIVCTRNRGDGLDQCLERFTLMEAPSGLSWEIVVVDNNSIDNTESVVHRFAERSGLDVRYVCERKAGLGHARNTGIVAARGDILAFTDDDCMVDKGWLGAIVKEFESDPELSGIGGRVELFDIRDKPITITTSKERLLLSVSHEFIGFVNGCNMAFTRMVFERMGAFDVRFGAGARFIAAEDSDFLYRVLKSKLKFVYTPDVLLFHNHGRRTDSQVEKLMKGYAIGRGAFYCKHIMKKDMFILKSAYWEVRSLLRTVAGKGQPKARRKKAWVSLRYLLNGFGLYLLTNLPHHE